MSDPLTFFSPAVVLATGGWSIQTSTPGTSAKRASGIGPTGDESASNRYDDRASLTETYKLFSGDATLPIVGSLVGGYHIDSVNVKYAEEDWPTLTVVSHKHTSGNGHSTMRQFTPTVTVIAQWGIPEDPFGITCGTLTTVGISSAEYNLTCTHLDILSAGVHLGAENRDGVETLSIAYVGSATPEPPSDDWTEMDTGGPNASNVGAEEGSAAWEQHLEADAVEA
jgi:hypothetical protein